MYLTSKLNNEADIIQSFVSRSELDIATGSEHYTAVQSVAAHMASETYGFRSGEQKRTAACFHSVRLAGPSHVNDRKTGTVQRRLQYKRRPIVALASTPLLGTVQFLLARFWFGYLVSVLRG